MVFTHSVSNSEIKSSTHHIQSRLRPASDCWPTFLELHKKLRFVLRRAHARGKIHLHDLKLCLDLFAMEQEDMPNPTLHTHHVDGVILEHRRLEKMKAVLSPACILELQAWDNAFSQNKHDRTLKRRETRKARRTLRAAASRSTPPKLCLTQQQVQELYGEGLQIEDLQAEPTTSNPTKPDIHSGLSKDQLGERLFVLISEKYRFPTLAGKITGMLLALEFGELSKLLKSPKQLLGRVLEALHILRLQEQQEQPSGQESNSELDSNSESGGGISDSESGSNSELEDFESNSEHSESCEWSKDWLQDHGREWGLDDEDTSTA